jgi:hypothetical protein
MNIVTDSIPTPSAHNKLSLPLQGPAAPTKCSPDGVANIQLKLMLWKSTDPSEAAIR